QVVKAISTTSLGSSSNPSNVGVVVTITATVTGLAPTGTVSFTDGGIAIGACSSVALTGSGNTRSAACSTGALPAGSHTIGASYAGDTGNVASNAAPRTQFVT